MRSILLAFLLFFALGAHVDAAPADDAKKAREAFNDGTTYFNLGQWEKAIEAWQAGYKLKSDPIFLYNIAQSYRLSDNFEKALFFYRSYLRNLPKAPNKAEVDQRIDDLEKSMEQRKKAREMPPEVPLTEQPKPEPPKPDTAAVSPASEPGTAVVVAHAPERPKPRRADLSVQAGIDLFALGAGSLALSGGFALSGGYDVFANDRLAIRLGAKIGYSFLGDTHSTVHFISLLADPMLRIRLWQARLYAFVEIGLGAVVLTGLDQGSVMLVARSLPSGAFAAFELRPAVGLEFRIVPAFALFLTPTLIYNNSPHQYFASSTLLRFDIQLGGSVRF